VPRAAAGETHLKAQASGILFEGSLPLPHCQIANGSAREARRIWRTRTRPTLSSSAVLPVTAAHGFSLAAGATLEVLLDNGDSPYGSRGAAADIRGSCAFAWLNDLGSGSHESPMPYMIRAAMSTGLVSALGGASPSPTRRETDGIAARSRAGLETFDSLPRSAYETPERALMAGRGPAPKDPRDRARSNSPPTPWRINRSSSPQPPLPATMPDGSEWPERTRQW
jgi:hypothetical protein